MTHRLRHYKILAKLGEGGMGEVFLAEDQRLERKTALKLLSPRFSSDPERLARFRREAKTVASLNHPNIVTIYSVEDDTEGPFLTMELIDGKTLDRVIPRGGFSLELFLEVAIPLVDALSVAHDKGITHRDLKPSNIMVNREGRVKVLDFGLAKLLDEPPISEAASLPSFGRVLGTVPYMSPEQLSGDQTDQHSDIFSLGIILYELATGEHPFQGGRPADLASSMLRDDPFPITGLNPGLPSELDDTIRCCLAKRPQDRFHSAGAVRTALMKLATGVPLTREVAAGEASVLRSLMLSNPSAESRATSGFGTLLTTRTGLSIIVGLVFLLNFLETFIEARLQSPAVTGLRLSDEVARGMQWLERGLSFAQHDATGTLAVYLNSISYFFVLPLLGLGVGYALLRRAQISAFRVFCLAVTVVYAISLPFFMFFPVPERWSYPESEATLLSDLWTPTLIESVRPISGLDNCFPSFHASLVVVIILCGYLFRVRLRNTVLFLGLTVLLATVTLGIHWIPDVIAGVAVGVLGVLVARRLDDRIDAWHLSRDPLARFARPE